MEEQGAIDLEDYALPYVDTDALQLRYLPDLFARASVLRGLPGAAGAEVVDFGLASNAAWPQSLPFRLVMGEGSGAPTLGGGVLCVALPNGDTARVLLSARMGAADVTAMGLRQWLAAASGPVAQFDSEALAGTNWTLTPWRELVLVHATRQPLLPPDFLSLNPRRTLGESVATFFGTLRLHRKSTVKVDVLATWNEPIDLLSEESWRTIQGEPREQGDEEMLSLGANRARHEFGDTKHRIVEYSAVATSRFTEYFLERLKGVVLGPTSCRCSTSRESCPARSPSAPRTAARRSWRARTTPSAPRRAWSARSCSTRPRCPQRPSTSPTSRNR